MKPHKAQPINLYRKIAVSFIVLTLVLLVVVLYFSLTRATIKVTPRQEKVDIDFLVSVEEQGEVQGPKTISGQILETTLSQTKSFPATGEKRVETEVTGYVTLINEYIRDQILVATTRLLSPEGVLFRLKNRVVIPAGGRLERVEIYADDPAAITEEIGPTRFTIPGFSSAILREKIYAESTEPFKAAGSLAKAVSGEDINGAKKSLQEELYEKALEEFTPQLKNGLRVLPRATLKELISLSVEAKEQAVQDAFEASATLKVTAVVFNEGELLNLARAQLEESLPSDKKLTGADFENFTYTIEKYDSQAKAATLRVYLAGQMVLSLSSPILDKEKLMGLSEEEVVAYLSGFEAIEAAEVNFSPFWVSQVPKLKDRIKIEIRK